MPNRSQDRPAARAETAQGTGRRTVPTIVMRPKPDCYHGYDIFAIIGWRWTRLVRATNQIGDFWKIFGRKKGRGFAIPGFWLKWEIRFACDDRRLSPIGPIYRNACRRIAVTARWYYFELGKAGKSDPNSRVEVLYNVNRVVE